MPLYVQIRIVVGLVMTVVAFAAWAWATFREKPDVTIAGWACAFMFLGMLSIVEK